MSPDLSPFHITACVPALARAVPPSARRVLLAGAYAGMLAAPLARQLPTCQLDRCALVAEVKEPALEAQAFDTIVYGADLGAVPDPAAVLGWQRGLLRPGGTILWAVPNAQHCLHLLALLRGEPPQEGNGLGRWQSWPTAYKILLDGGYVPCIRDSVVLPCPPDLLAALTPLLQREGLHPARAQRDLSATWFVLQGTPLVDEDASGADTTGDLPLTFVACVADEAGLRADLLRSPCLRPGTPHELLLYRGCASAADGLNRGLVEAKNPLVVCLHQDVYLPAGWPRRFLRQYARAEQAFGPLGVAGVYGVTCQGEAVIRAGRVVDRDHLLHEPAPMPGAVDALDELLLALPRGTDLRFDSPFGFHLYGADLCLEARVRRLPAVALDALCFHNSRTLTLPPAFSEAAQQLARKWAAQLPLATPCGLIDARGGLRFS